MAAATVVITESNGISGSQVDTVGISNINFGSVDSPNLLPTGRMIIIGQNSYTKYERIHVTNFGTNNNLYNFYFWKSAGALKSNESLFSNIFGVDGATFRIINYETPSQVSDASVADVPTSLPTNTARIPFTGSQTTILNTTGISNYIRIQTRTTESTPTGAGNQKTFTFRYDEN